MACAVIFNYFTGTWVDLNDRKRPKTAPQLIGWATPEGWLQGFRSGREGNFTSSERTTGDVGVSGDSRQNGKAATAETGAMICQIERMEPVVGKRMDRGLLKL